MPKKTQSVSRPTQRDAGNPVESRSNGNIVTNQLNGHSQDVHARVTERAYALYEERGREDGHALKDWLAAERQMLDHG